MLDFFLCLLKRIFGRITLITQLAHSTAIIPHDSKIIGFHLMICNIKMLNNRYVYNSCLYIWYYKTNYKTNNRKMSFSYRKKMHLWYWHFCKSVHWLISINRNTRIIREIHIFKLLNSLILKCNLFFCKEIIVR